jgi:lactate dehydrogenase-like 2-hydroxyacid dehydrogenase
VKVIATYSVGFEHIDLAGASRRKIAIAYTPGINSEATADIAMLLMLGASRRAYEAQEILRAGKWKSSSPNTLLGWQSAEKGWVFLEWDAWGKRWRGARAALE